MIPHDENQSYETRQCQGDPVGVHDLINLQSGDCDAYQRYREKDDEEHLE